MLGIFRREIRLEDLVYHAFGDAAGVVGNGHDCLATLREQRNADHRTADLSGYQRISGIDQVRVPYALRHTFAAWGLIINIAPLKLHKLMGHASKKMVYEIYGGLRGAAGGGSGADQNLLRGGLRRVATKKPRPAKSESFGESRG